jgi:hypothetical protein
MRYLILLLLLLSLQGCSKYAPVQIIDTDEVTRQAVLFSHEMKAEHHLHLEHAYYCENRDDLLKTIYLEYWTQDQFEICKARHVLVDVVEGFLRRINENEILRHARANLPFTPLNLEIVIRSTTFYGKYIDILLTERICMKDGIVRFIAFDASPDVTNRIYVSDYLHEHREDYGVTLANVSAELEATVPYYDKYRQAPGRARTRMNYPPVPKIYPPIVGG